MQLPEKVYDTLVWICNEYPYPTIQDDYHLGEILNFVAYMHRADGWGLSYKAGGTFVDSPVGPVAEDILQLPDGNHFDVLQGAGVGKPLNPSRATSIGIIDLQSRPWVAPKDHTPRWLNPGPTTPEPEKPTEPTPCVCKFEPHDCVCKFDDSKVTQLAVRVEELAAHFDGVLNDVLVRLDRNFNKPSGGNCVFRRG